MATRLRRGGVRSRYRVVEPVFGQIKSALGFTRFFLRGLGKVAAEWGLVSTAHNLRKLIAARSQPLRLPDVGLRFRTA